MLTIRKKQMEAFEQEAIERFENEMVLHLAQFSPRSFDFAGEKHVRDAIQLGIVKSGSYGFTNVGPVRFFIELMSVLGSYFDSDPQIPGAKEILVDTTITCQKERAHWLYKHTDAYIKNVAGHANKNTLMAMKAVRLLLDKPSSSYFSDFESNLLHELSRIYPQKCEYLGNNSLSNFSRVGIQLAKAYSFQTTRGVSLFVLLMFTLGHRFMEDPFFHSFSEIFKNLKTKDPYEREAALISETASYFDKVLAVERLGKQHERL